MKLKQKFMWAGIVEDGIAAEVAKHQNADPYLPVNIALFDTEKEARKRFETVVKVEVAKLLAIPKGAVKKSA